MSQLKTNSIANVAGTASTDVLNVINGSAKAWVNFNGTGTVSVRQAFNVSSITDNALADYTINFTNSMPGSTYCVASAAGGASGQSFVAIRIESRATTSTRLSTIGQAAGTSSAVDVSNVFLAVFN